MQAGRDDDDEKRNVQHAAGRELLLAQTRAIDVLIHDMLSLDPDGTSSEVRVPMLMLQAAGTSIHSVLALTGERDMAIRDCFAIARSAVETSLNAAFVAASGEPMAVKAVRHMRQKRWRDLRREGTAGPLSIAVSRNVGLAVDDLPGLREALDEFTDGKGRERPFWTKASVANRVGAVTRRHRRAGLCLSVATFAIYRPASELIHGSYYGVNLFWQGSRDAPVRGRREFDRLWMEEHFITLLTALFFAVSGAIDCIAEVNALPHHARHQDELSARLSELIEAMAGPDIDPDHTSETSPSRS